MLLNAAIMLVVLIVALLLWSPKFLRSQLWTAMTTPLASIIGSGFLVLGPILNAAYGKYSPLVMAALCLVAYLYGAAIRYNMTALASVAAVAHVASRIEAAASWSLGLAYIISVTYYLNLFGAFGVSLTPLHQPIFAKLLTSAALVAITVVGWQRGFKALERMEYISVTAKLAVIAGLLLGLGVFAFDKVTAGLLVSNAPTQTGWPAVTLAFGLIVTVQGFEISRYLGATYDSKTRILSMRCAQWLSAAIYMAYIVLLAYAFEDVHLELTETTIIDMVSVVAPLLPLLLVAAALAAQFSAAVADTSGAGGLIAELTANRVKPRSAYALLALVGLGLTWAANVFEIINYASRAFAVYYALQASVATTTAWSTPGHRRRASGFAALAVLGLSIAIFGQALDV